MEPKRKFADAFERDLITIVAGNGQGQRTFTVHKSILTQIKFFAGCLSEGFPEGQNDHIRLEADEPEIFECLLEYAYSGKIAIVIDNSPSGILGDLERSHLMLFTKAYILADKYCWEECQNYAMDRFREHYSVNIACSLTVAELERAKLGTSRLQQLQVDRMCHSTAGSYKGACQIDEKLSPFIRNRRKAVEDLVEACVDTGYKNEEVRNPTAFGSPCD